jgi:hypothetical protein
MSWVVPGRQRSGLAPTTRVHAADSIHGMTNPSAVTRAAAGPVLAALALATLVACQSGGSVAQPPAATPAGDQQILAIGREYSQCVRDHGVSTFPDMVVIAGQLSLPDNATGDAADQALRANPTARSQCASILRRLPAAAQKNQALTAQDRANLLRYAQCMRQNGVPEWPDPSATGSFPITGTPLADQLKSARVLRAQQACRQFWAGEISVK